ncbi:MAG: Hsp33 family molecular chaperone HslO [Rhodospirillales bacterium]|nr:Hsp33 family molecular chaperone HslO [Rhodospirillales bacterium]
MKFDGRMTVEIRSDGPIRLLAVDYMSDSKMRGYASVDRDRVFEPKPLSFGCSCSGSRALAVLRRISATEIEDFVVDGEIEVICQFCNRRQVFTPEEVLASEEGERRDH